MDKHEIARAKALRSDIIEKLYDFYGEPVSISTLRNLLRYKTYYSEKNITKAIDYLSGTDKEFVEVEPDENNYWDSLIRLAPKGVNLAEGDIKDMGVVIDE